VTCDHCRADTTNGLALCAACIAWFLINTEFVPVYFRNLSRWRPSSASGVRSVPGSREPRLPGVAGTDRIGRALDETYGDLMALVRKVAASRPQHAAVVARIATFEEERTVRLSCALLTKHVDSFTTLPWVSELLVGISGVEQRLREETERAIPGWYAGACQLCGIDTHVVPGLTWVTCQGCGATTYARDHLEVILKEAAHWIATPAQLSGALVALLDGEVSVFKLRKRITAWGNREKIEVHRNLDDDGDPVGPKRYRLGEVLSMLDAEAPGALAVS
jgi:hypothetical protein